MLLTICPCKAIRYYFWTISISLLFRTEEDEPTDDGDGLLSAFKVASLAVDEDEAVETAATIGGSGGGGIQKLWENIIPG